MSNAISQNRNGFDSETVKQMIEIQSREIELRGKDIEFKKQQDDHSYEFAKIALVSQEKDRNLQREYLLKASRNLYLLIGFFLILVISLIVIALLNNKEAVATEVIKAIAYVLGGGLGGYGLAKSKIKHSQVDLTR